MKSCRFPSLGSRICSYTAFLPLAFGLFFTTTACSNILIQAEVPRTSVEKLPNGQPSPSGVAMGSPSHQSGQDEASRSPRSSEPTKVARPVFVNQSEASIDTTLSDGKFHFISVLFYDRVKIRVQDRRFVALNDDIGAVAALNSVLDNYRLKGISSSFGTEGKTEEELAQQESEAEARSSAEVDAKIDIPNHGSWATLALDDYTPERAKALTLELQQLPFVRYAGVDPSIGNNAGGIIGSSSS